MMRSLYSGVSGLKTHQTRMDVIGNNIANVNTVAYKYQTMTFSELMYQTTQTASGPNAAMGTGGVNPRQIGLGVKTGSMTTAISQPGSSQATGNPFDFKITGSSFFIVSDGSKNYFTRDGSFYVDPVGNLAMSSNGFNVMGWQVDPNTGLIRKDTVSPLKVLSPANMTYEAEATSKATISGILDKTDTALSTDEGKIISLEFHDNRGYTYTAKFAFKPQYTTANPPVMVADTYDLVLSDLQEIRYDPKTGKQEAVSVLNEDPYKDQVKLNGSNGVCTVKFNASTGALEEVNSSGDLKTIELTFGTLLDASEQGDPSNGTPGPFKNIVIDLSGATGQYKEGTSTIGIDKGDMNDNGNGSGRLVGELYDVSVDNNGMIWATYDNNMRRLLGQIAVAEFANPSGLSKQGDNLYAATQNSGAFDGIGDDVTANGGYIEAGVLEMSNVDLSGEFTEMIVTQRGFQANSRIITVSDTLLEELINLKR